MKYRNWNSGAPRYKLSE